MSITPQERELVIIAAAVACGCKACIRQDLLTANQLHVTDNDISDTIAVAIDIRRCATSSVEDFISSGFVNSKELEKTATRHRSPRRMALVSVGAAFAANCTTGLKKQVAAAREIGIDEEDLDSVVCLSSFIKAMAASQVERMMDPDSFEDDSVTLAEYGTPFGPVRCAWAEVCKCDSERYLRSLGARN